MSPYYETEFECPTHGPRAKDQVMIYKAPWDGKRTRWCIECMAVLKKIDGVLTVEDLEALAGPIPGLHDKHNFKCDVVPILKEDSP